MIQLNSIVGRIIRGYTALLIRDKEIYITSGIKLRKLNESLLHDIPVATEPLDWPLNIAACFRLFERAGKLTFRELSRTAKNNIIGVIRKQLVLLLEGENSFKSVLKVESGGRPKGLVTLPSGKMYVGEYGLNPQRKAMRIWGNNENEGKWEQIYTLKAGTLRHIHNIIWDPYRKGLWVLTGDLDRECAFLFTDDEFKTVKQIVRGGQSYRACNLFCRPEGLYYATDSELDENWMVFFEPTTLKMERIQPLPGSSIYANFMAGHYFISTCVEPSKVNRYKFATLWCSKNLYDWKKVIEFEKDFWPGEYFGFGNIILPKIDGECPFIVFSAVAVKKYDNTTFIFKPEELGL